MSLIEAVILSLLPISELRGGIPWAIASGVKPVVAFFVCTLANMLVIPIVFFFLDFVHKHLTVMPIYNKVFDSFLERTRKRVHPKVARWGCFGLMLFVAVPLPVTGAYTGTLAAWFFGLRGKGAYLCLALGVLIAGVIVTMVTVSGIEIFRIFIK